MFETDVISVIEKVISDKPLPPCFNSSSASRFRFNSMRRSGLGRARRRLEVGLPGACVWPNRCWPVTRIGPGLGHSRASRLVINRDRLQWWRERNRHAPFPPRGAAVRENVVRLVSEVRWCMKWRWMLLWVFCLYDHNPHIQREINANFVQLFCLNSKIRNLIIAFIHI